MTDGALERTGGALDRIVGALERTGAAMQRIGYPEFGSLPCPQLTLQKWTLHIILGQ